MYVVIKDVSHRGNSVRSRVDERSNIGETRIRIGPYTNDATYKGRKEEKKEEKKRRMEDDRQRENADEREFGNRAIWQAVVREWRPSGTWISAVRVG